MSLVMWDVTELIASLAENIIIIDLNPQNSFSKTLS